MAVTSDQPAPYAPASAILGILDRYRNRGMQSPFTAEVLGRSGISDSLIPRTLQALTTLELIDQEGHPTETLENLRRVPEPEYEKALAAWLANVYADVFSFVDAKDDETSIRDAFRNYNPVGQQSRMVSLFVGLCRAAGLRSDEGKESTPRRKKVVRKKIARRTPSGGTSESKRHTHTGLPPALEGLVNSLPDDGQSWTQEERNKFLATFEAVLDFCYSVQEPDESED